MCGQIATQQYKFVNRIEKLTWALLKHAHITSAVFSVLTTFGQVFYVYFFFPIKFTTYAVLSIINRVRIEVENRLIMAALRSRINKFCRKKIYE